MSEKFRRIPHKAFALIQPELHDWLQEIMRGSHGYEVDQMVYLSKPTFRIRFSSENYDYVVVSCRATLSGGKQGTITCTASPRNSGTINGKPFEADTDIPGGDYCEESWTRIVHRIAILEMMKSVRFSRTGGPLRPVESD